jgi:serine/threonine protein phosphatase 1
MAHYVMSDIHGEADRFYAMLDKIGFLDTDALYILGDVVDRGPEGVRLLRDIMERPNITLLMGNHEHMMLQYYGPEATEERRARWDRNGNAPTKAAYEALPAEAQAALLDFVATRPGHLELTVGGRDFYLVHAFPAETLYEEVWTRPGPDTPNPLPGKQVIIGHTKVVSMLHPVKEDRRPYEQALADRGDHIRILHRPGFIDLDCGCGYNTPAKRLSCLRLEDMAEFYV